MIIIVVVAAYFLVFDAPTQEAHTLDVNIGPGDPLVYESVTYNTIAKSDLPNGINKLTVEVKDFDTKETLTTKTFLISDPSKWTRTHNAALPLPELEDMAEKNGKVWVKIQYKDGVGVQTYRVSYSYDGSITLTRLGGSPSGSGIYESD